MKHPTEDDLPTQTRGEVRDDQFPTYQESVSAASVPPQPMEDEMKRTVELDTLDICDRISNLGNRLHIARLACDGLDGDDEGNILIGSMIFEIEQELKEIGDEIHPARPEEEIAHIKRDAEKRIAEWQGNGVEEVAS
jgi:hypothetical protein